jgi:hypothetical protein
MRPQLKFPSDGGSAYRARRYAELKIDTGTAKNASFKNKGEREPHESDA